jgi:hypothetical protein
MAAIVRQAALLEEIRFLKATERRLRSSDETSAPFCSRTSAKKVTMSSNLSACSATRARKIFSSTDIISNLINSVEEKIFLARVAEQAERFEDMVTFLAEVLEQKGADVSSDERNLLSVAFKNLISSKRAACRTIAAIEQNPKYQKYDSALATYKSRIEDSLTKDCQ